jgi:hypothetical protein
MKIVIVIIIGILIFLGIRLLRLGLKYLINHYPRLNVIGKIMVLAEFLIWITYIFQSGNFLFHGKFFYQYLVYGLILILLIFLTWFFLLDIFAGVLFRIRYSLALGTFIHAGNISGQIKSYGLTSVLLLTNEGLIQNIPYSKIISEVITEEGFYGIIKENIFHIQADLSLGREQSEELIRTALLNAPWSNPKEEPLIRFIEENEKGLIYEVTLFTKKKKHLKLIAESLGKFPFINISY